MTRQEHLEFCKNCKLKSFNAQKGVTCSLTNDIANFEIECPDYDEDEIIEKAKPLATKSNSNTLKIVSVIIATVIILILVLLLTQKKELTDNKLVSNVSFYDSFSEEDCINFAITIETGIRNYHPESLDDNIDFRYIEKCISTKINLPHEERKYLLNLLKQRINPGEISVAGLESGGDFSFRAYYEEDNVPHIVFRTFYNQNIQYIDYELGIKNDKIVIRDAFNYTLGENWSVTIAEIALRNTSKSINTSQNDLAKAIKKYNVALKLLQTNEYQKASEVFYTIPYKFRTRDQFKMLELNIAAGYNTVKYIKIIDLKITNHPLELRFTSFYNMLKFCTMGDANQTIKHIKQLNQFVNNDPILDFYIGMAYYNNNELANAQEYFEKFITSNPFIIDGYDILILLCIEQKDIASAMKTVNLIRENFNITKEELHEHLIDYEVLLNSNEYKFYFKNSPTL